LAAAVLAGAEAAALGAAAGSGTAVPVTSVAAGGSAGLGWFLPASGAFGFQSLFFLASTASLSGLRAWLLFMKGTGTLVM
jgi:hypothetical protein